MPPDVRRARVYYEGHLSSHRWRFFVPEPGTHWAGLHGGAETWRDAYDRACAQIGRYKCECWVTPESTWFVHYGAVEPGSQMEQNPDCPVHPAAVLDEPAERAWPCDPAEVW